MASQGDTRPRRPTPTTKDNLSRGRRKQKGSSNDPWAMVSDETERRAYLVRRIHG